jgi:predicted aminopeptidase
MVGYYWQSVEGHLSLLQAARPVPEWLADERTPFMLRERLELSQRLRNYAVRALGLPDNASYRRYAALNRSAAVWNVVATPELSLTLKTWCFPVLGCVGYRGYFDRAQADEKAAELKAEGLEVSVYGVPAYSTLGRLPGTFFADPLISTVIDWPEGELARLIFHELAHQVAYASDDTGFNESFATAVERIGAARWLASGQATPGAAQADALSQSRREDFRAIVARCRADLDALYRSAASDEQKRLGKAALFARLRADHAALKADPLKADRWALYTGYDRWVAQANNAVLGIQSAYNDRVETFQRVFEQQGQDFARFYAEVRRLAALPKAERDQALQAIDVSGPSKQLDGVTVALPR